MGSMQPLVMKESSLSDLLHRTRHVPHPHTTQSTSILMSAEHYGIVYLYRTTCCRGTHSSMCTQLPQLSAQRWTPGCMSDAACGL